MVPMAPLGQAAAVRIVMDMLLSAPAAINRSSGQTWNYNQL